MQNFTIEQVTWTDNLDILRGIRTTVFVEEQNVPQEEEWDGQDDTAIHVLAMMSNGKPVGTARLLESGQIGRMAVLHDYRKRGIGGSMLSRLLKIAAENNIRNLFLNSQFEAIPFYKKFGFIEQGETFMEAGILHRKMVFHE